MDAGDAPMRGGGGGGAADHMFAARPPASDKGSALPAPPPPALATTLALMDELQRWQQLVRGWPAQRGWGISAAGRVTRAHVVIAFACVQYHDLHDSIAAGSDQDGSGRAAAGTPRQRMLDPLAASPGVSTCGRCQRCRPIITCPPFRTCRVAMQRVTAWTPLRCGCRRRRSNRRSAVVCVALSMQVREYGKQGSGSVCVQGRGCAVGSRSFPLHHRSRTNGSPATAGAAAAGVPSQRRRRNADLRPRE